MRYAVIRDVEIQVRDLHREFDSLHHAERFTFPGIDVAYRKIGENLYTYDTDTRGVHARPIGGNVMIARLG